MLALIDDAKESRHPLGVLSVGMNALRQILFVSVRWRQRRREPVRNHIRTRTEDDVIQPFLSLLVTRCK